MQVIIYAVFFVAFSYLMVTAKSRRKLVAVTLTAVMVTTLVARTIAALTGTSPARRPATSRK